MALEDLTTRRPMVFTEYAPEDVNRLAILRDLTCRLERADELDRERLTPRFAGYLAALRQYDATPAAILRGNELRERAYGKLSDAEFDTYVRACNKKFPWRRPASWRSPDTP